MAKQALHPITWHQAQALLMQLGYQLMSHNKDGRFATFRLSSEVSTEGKRNPITIAHPDFVGADGKTPAYERDYVVDLISQALGGNGGAKPIMTLLANLDCN